MPTPSEPSRSSAATDKATDKKVFIDPAKASVWATVNQAARAQAGRVESLIAAIGAAKSEGGLSPDAVSAVVDYLGLLKHQLEQTGASLTNPIPPTLPLPVLG